MGQIIYNILTGTPNFTAHLEPEVLPNQIHIEYGEYSYENVPDGTYTLTVRDGNFCIGMINNIIISNTINLNSVFYGYLYNGYIHQDIRGITSSDNWHVSTQKEYDESPPSDWSTLMNYTGLGYAQGYCGDLKETDLNYWNFPNTGATNLLKFNARAGGYRFGDVFSKLGQSFCCGDGGGEWSWGGVTVINHNSDQLDHWGGFGNSIGLSIRLCNNSTLLNEGEEGVYIGNDGKQYSTIVINGIEWLASNLAETKYRNKEWITGFDNGIYTPIINDTWIGLEIGALCAYNNDENNVDLQD